MEAIDINFTNFCRITGLYSKDKTVQEMIPKCVLNTVLYHVSLSCIIPSNKQMKYDSEENNPDRLNKSPWYNTDICYKLYGTVFEDYTRNAIIDRYNIMCYITAHDKILPIYVDDTGSGGGRAITKNA